MAYGETAERRAARLDRQRQQYPELEVATPHEIGNIDRIFRDRGEPPTTFGARVQQDAAELYAGRGAFDPYDSGDVAPEPDRGGFVASRSTPVLGGLGSLLRKGQHTLGDVGAAVSGLESRIGLDPQGGFDPGAGLQSVSSALRSRPAQAVLSPLGTALQDTLNPERTLNLFGRSTQNLIRGRAPATSGGGEGLGTDLAGRVESVPVVGPYARRGLDIALAPGASSFGAANTALTAVGGVGARQLAKKAGAPEWAQTVADIAGSVALPAAAPALKRVATGYRDITENIPVGMSVKRTGPDGKPLPNNAPWAKGPPELQSAVPEIQDALKAEVQLRRSGTIQSEISAGRARQAGRIAGNLEGVRAAGGNLDDALRAASSGAKVGTLRQTFGQPLELTEQTKTALSNHLQDALKGREFEQFNGLKALDSLIRGENVQPAQLKLLGRVFGDDFAKLAAEANMGRPSAIAEITPEARSAIDSALKGERQITIFEQRAKAQATHADDLLSQYRMNPTDARLKAVADEARAKGLAFANQADDLTMEQGRRYTAEVMARNTKNAAAEASQGIKAIENAALKADRLTPGEEQLIAQAKAMLGEVPGVSSAVDREAVKSVEYWIKAARQYRSTIGETTHVKMAEVSAALTGNLSDSYLTTLYQNRLVATRALELSGTDPVVAKKVADLLVQSQLKARYPGGVPQRLLDEIEKTKGLAHGDVIDQTLQTLGAVSQEWKNLAFGPMDIGIVGQQGLRATTEMGPINILTGAANRILNKVEHPLYEDPLTAGADAVARRLQYARDGLGVGVNTGAVQPGEGLGILGKTLGPVGRAAEKWIAFNTKLQFDKVLGGLRDLDHEGNLAILDFLGRDTSNPAVRATSAKFANVATSFAPGALNARRAAAETGLMMTPSMRRAQIQGIGQVAKVFTKNATPEERILGSILILNKYAIRTAIGLAVNHYFGVGDYAWDQSKKGYGSVVSKIKNGEGQNIVLGLSPQGQIENALAQSVRALAEADPEELRKVWLKLGLGTSGPALQVIEKAAGYGYAPGKGYQMGDFGEGLTGTQRKLASGLAPLPPILQSATQGTLSPQTTPLEVGGVQNFPESPTAGTKRDPNYYQSLKGEAQFNAIKPQAWKVVGKPFAAQTEGYDSYYDWYAARLATVTTNLEKSQPPGVAGEMAKQLVAKHPVAQAYLDVKNALETQWIAKNPEQADRLIQEERLQANATERGLIGAGAR